jgi:hypothetical protein
MSNLIGDNITHPMPNSTLEADRSNKLLQSEVKKQMNLTHDNNMQNFVVTQQANLQSKSLETEDNNLKTYMKAALSVAKFQAA